MKEAKQLVVLTHVTRASSEQLEQLAIDSLTGSEWMSKQTSGDSNNGLTMAQSPVKEDKGSETTR